MNKDNEIYVTSNGELYKKGVEQAIYPQTNYTTQKFYTKKEYDKLQAEYDDLHLNYAGCKTANTGLQELNQKLQAENEKLKQVANDSIIEQEKLIAKVNELQAENERLKARLRPLEDSYFNGLSSIEIAELAKKSIRITAENRKLEDALQEIREYCEEQNLKADYTACEILDKINEVIGAE